MTEPFFAEHDVSLYRGDVRDVLPMLAAESVNCVVTSPPYYGLRDYGVDGQIGLEASPAEYVETMRAVFAEVRRVLRRDGTLWLNLGDTYARNPAKGYTGTMNGRNLPRMGYAGGSVAPDLPEKNLLGMPWRVAFALQDEGWVLRSAIIWHKPNAMPESITDRLANRYEHLFLLTKDRRYWFDLDPIREERSGATMERYKLPFGETGLYGTRKPDVSKRTSGKYDLDRLNPAGKNPGDVWSIPTQPFPGAHFATFAPALVHRCILAGCPQDGVVLDPFAGSGTTLMVAKNLLRRSVGVELSPEYCDLIIDRIGQPSFDFGEVPA